jgi:putative membrane protein
VLKTWFSNRNDGIIQIMIQKIILAVKGFCMGAADVVPGVSGGTMAFILGIYTQLIEAVRSFDTKWVQHVFKLEMKQALQRPHFGFLIPLVIGIFCALLFFTRVIPLHTLLHSHPELIYGLFFGLIVGSVIALLPEIGRFDIRAGFFLGIGILLGWLIVNLVPVDTPDAAWFIFLSGMLAISAMLLPGISGSFILLILHKYDTILGAIGRFNLMVLIPFGLGALTGLIVFSRVLSWLLAHYYRVMLQVIIGILIGTLWIIWPFQVRKYEEIHNKERLISSTPYWPDTWNETVLYALFMVLIGIALVLIIHAWGKQLDKQNG